MKSDAKASTVETSAHGVPVTALLAVALWGGSFVAVDVALASFTPFGLTALRLALGAAVLALVARLRNEPILPVAADRVACLVLGLTLAAHLSIQAHGLLYTSSVHTGWIVGFTPVVSALGARLFLGRQLRSIGWLGVFVATAGVWLVTTEEPVNMADATFGDALQLFTCVTWTIYCLVGVRAVERSGARRVAGCSMLVASCVLIVIACATGWMSGPATAQTIGSVIYLGLFCNAVAFSLWYSAQRKHGVYRTAVTLYFEPFVTLIVAMIVLGEGLSPIACIGGVIVLVGVWLVARPSRPRR